jgi:agmatinase
MNHFSLPARPAGPVQVNRPDERALAGIQTFMKLPVCLTPEDLRAGEMDVAVCGVPWDSTSTGRSGTHLGPMGIRSADYLGGYGTSLPHLDVRVDPLDHLRACDYGDAPVLVGNTLGTFEGVRAFIGGIVETGAVPLIMGGDHGITWPTATAVADHYGHGKVGIVHFDAHADTGPDAPGTLAGHGTPMRRLIESGAIPGRNFVQVGLRGYWPGQDVLDWMEANELRTHFMAEIRADGFDAVLARAVDEALDSADHLYLSLDIDVCDPAYAPGTGTPEPGGLTSAEVLRAVRRLAAEVGIVAMDVVEVSPPYDGNAGITSLLAHRALREAMTGTAMRRLGLTAPDYIDPRALGGRDTRTYRP